MTIAGQLLLQVVLILLNAFFAATEIAVISQNAGKLRMLADEGDRKAEKILKMAEQPSGFLSTIQVGITLAGFLGSAFAADNFSDPLVEWIIKDLGFTAIPEATLNAVCVILITIILSYFTLIFGELVPKRIAMQKPLAVARFSCGIIGGVARLMGPIITFLSFSTNTVLKILHVQTDDEVEAVTPDEIRMMVDMGEEKGTIEPEEKELIDNIFDFGDTTASEVMTHWIDIVAIYAEDSDEEVIKTIRESGRSRYPYCGEDINDIRGILYARDFLLAHASAGENEKIDREALLRPSMFVPEAVHIDELLRNMQKKNLHIAVVVDEYGATSGIVTMEDILEELVGNIYDEFDKAERPEIEKVSEDEWRIAGGAPLEDVEEALDVEFSDDKDAETLAGLILGRLGSIPVDGSTVEITVNGFSMRVEKIEDRRIEQVCVKKLPQQAEEERGEEEAK